MYSINNDFQMSCQFLGGGGTVDYSFGQMLPGNIVKVAFKFNERFQHL